MLHLWEVDEEIKAVFDKCDFIYKTVRKSSIFTELFDIRIFYIKDRQLNYVTCHIHWLEGNKAMLKYKLEKAIDKIKLFRKDN